MELTKLTEICEGELEAAKPYKAMGCFRLCFKPDKIILEGTDIILEGKDIGSHLKSCRFCAVFAVTLGFKADIIIKRAQVTDMVKAVILDRMANDAVARLSKKVLARIKAENKYTTDILSPGCGDFSIKYQKQILASLNADKRCGITTTASGVLIPVKSMTGVVGISHNPVCVTPRGCENCRLENCRYGGKTK